VRTLAKMRNMGTGLLFVPPLFYGERERFLDVMLHAIALNGSFFHTQRMLLQYVLKAYF
jgi:glycogen phosphorylase